MAQDDWDKIETFIGEISSLLYHSLPCYSIMLALTVILESYLYLFYRCQYCKYVFKDYYI